MQNIEDVKKQEILKKVQTAFIEAFGSDFDIDPDSINGTLIQNIADMLAHSPTCKNIELFSKRIDALEYRLAFMHKKINDLTIMVMKDNEEELHKIYGIKNEY